MDDILASMKEIIQANDAKATDPNRSPGSRYHAIVLADHAREIALRALALLEKG